MPRCGRALVEETAGMADGVTVLLILAFYGGLYLLIRLFSRWP